jgi:flagellar protein FliS
MIKAYREGKILSADPLELVRLLYHGAMDAVAKARTHLANGEIAERSAAITKAMSIVAELNGSLDHQAGGEISRNLGRLYAYMLQRLLQANLKQSDGPLAEVLGLLSTMGEAWDTIAAAQGCRVKPAAIMPESPKPPLFDRASARFSSAKAMADSPAWSSPLPSQEPLPASRIDLSI